MIRVPAIHAHVSVTPGMHKHAANYVDGMPGLMTLKFWIVKTVQRGKIYERETAGGNHAASVTVGKRTDKYELVQYVGIAADEPKRIKDLNYPLVEWGWTEADCLRCCYEHGFDWGGLYEKFNRVSCWCCPLKNLKSLKALRRDFPDLWATLLDWQHKTWRKFRADYSVDELDARFAREDEMERMQVKLDFGGCGE